MSIPGSGQRRGDPPWHLTPLTFSLLPWGSAVYESRSLGSPPCPLPFMLPGSQTHCVSSVQEGGAQQVTRKNLDCRPDSIISPGCSACPQLLTLPPLSPPDPSQIQYSSPTQLRRPPLPSWMPTVANPIDRLGHICPQGSVSLTPQPAPCSSHISALS